MTPAETVKKLMEYVPPTLEGPVNAKQEAPPSTVEWDQIWDLAEKEFKAIFPEASPLVAEANAATHADAKQTNPKDIIGATKCPTGLVPDIPDEAMAFLEGALKYGRYNWRIAGVRASIYNDAMDRHRKKWWNGQNRDPVTRVRELVSVIACAKIILDAELCGMLTDDRPPAAPIGKALDEIPELVAHLKELFKDHHPRQFVLADKPLESEPLFEAKYTHVTVGVDLGKPGDER